MDRRDFIKLSGISILASSTNILAMEILEKEEKPKSGGKKMKVMKLQPKDHLKPKGLVGISDEQIEVHFEAHYKGYVAKYNEIQEKLASNFADRSKANQTTLNTELLKLRKALTIWGLFYMNFILKT